MPLIVVFIPFCSQTVREIMQTANSAGECLYWGYGQGTQHWNGMMEMMNSTTPDHEAAQQSRLCVEAHFPIAEPSVFARHKQLVSLKSQGVRVVETTRVREPLEYYLVCRQSSAPAHPAPSGGHCCCSWFGF